MYLIFSLQIIEFNFVHEVCVILIKYNKQRQIFRNSSTPSQTTELCPSIRYYSHVAGCQSSTRSTGQCFLATGTSSPSTLSSSPSVSSLPYSCSFYYHIKFPKSRLYPGTGSMIFHGSGKIMVMTDSGSATINLTLFAYLFYSSVQRFIYTARFQFLIYFCTGLQTNNTSFCWQSINQRR